MSSEPVLRALPTVLLCIGAVFTVGVDRQRSMELDLPLTDAVPMDIGGFRGREVEISDWEQQVAGMSDYLYRVYGDHEATEDELATAGVSVYVGYYESQTQGVSIHSPRNCLPGAGWSALQNRPYDVETAEGTYTINQYIMQREDARAVVLYWYQGRGRVAWNEYAVKWDLLRDAAIHGRTEEALVRVVVPVVESEEAALATAAAFAGDVIPAVFSALPSAHGRASAREGRRFTMRAAPLSSTSSLGGNP